MHQRGPYIYPISTTVSAKTALVPFKGTTLYITILAHTVSNSMARTPKTYTAESLAEHKTVRNGCWEWTKTSDNGYGVCRHAGKLWRTHRLSAVLHRIKGYKDIESNVVLHTCDNPICFNPKHLQIGTQWDNVQDMRRKGRYRHHIQDK